MDENPLTINDGSLVVSMAQIVVDFPANFHGGGAGLAFADGHSEIHKWMDVFLMLVPSPNLLNPAAEVWSAGFRIYVWPFRKIWLGYSLGLQRSGDAVPGLSSLDLHLSLASPSVPLPKPRWQSALTTWSTDSRTGAGDVSAVRQSRPKTVEPIRKFKLPQRKHSGEISDRHAEKSRAEFFVRRGG